MTKSSGEVTFDKCLIQKRNSFLEYIFGGCELNLAIAIDYTGSNSDPDIPGSLHWNQGPGINPYQQAILEVGAIVEPYDYDK